MLEIPAYAATQTEIKAARGILSICSLIQSMYRKATPEEKPGLISAQLVKCQAACSEGMINARLLNAANELAG